MSFSDPIAGGPNGILKRNSLQSQNFVTTVSGWRIARDGTAEFLDALIRGSLVVSGVDGSYIRLDVDNLGNPFISLYPPNPGGAINFQPAFIQELAIGTQSILSLAPAWVPPGGDFGQIEIFGGAAGDDTGLRITGEMTNALDAIVYARAKKGNVQIVVGAADTAKSLATNFGVAFPLGTTPIILTNMNNSSGAAGNWISKGMGPTNTGFTMRIFGPAPGGAGFTADIDYVAIEPHL